MNDIPLMCRRCCPMPAPVDISRSVYYLMETGNPFTIMFDACNCNKAMVRGYLGDTYVGDLDIDTPIDTIGLKLISTRGFAEGLNMRNAVDTILQYCGEVQSAYFANNNSWRMRFVCRMGKTNFTVIVESVK